MEAAATAAGGLALVRAVGPDLVLLDRSLPDDDGLHLLPMVHRGRPDLPVLMITGDPRPATRAQALRVGAVAVLDKLCDPNVLLAAVAEALRSANPCAASGPLSEPGDAPRGGDSEPAST